MPRLSDSMEEGTILKWLKSDGDEVAKGDELAEIETDKATMTYEADSAGVLKIRAQEGETLPIGEVIATIGEGSGGGDAGGGDEQAQGEEEASAESDGAAQDEAPAQEEEAPAQEVATKERDGGGGNGKAGGAERPAPAPARAEGNGQAGDGRVKASPVARRIAREKGIDLQALSGTGPGGRIVKADVEKAADGGGDGGGPVDLPAIPQAEEKPAAPEQPEGRPDKPKPPPPVVSEGATGRGDVEVVELTRTQQVIARRMAESKATVPEFTLQADIDMEQCVELRGRLKQIADPAPSYNDMIVKACALALRDHPRANGAYKDGHFELFSRVNVGVAVAAENALIVPVVLDADRKGLGAIARESRTLAERVRAGVITPPELANGTFTVSNLGMFGIREFTAVINPPQAAILAVGAMRPLPVARDGEVSVRNVMSVTLACDHRILYGAEAAQFLGRIRELLEEPLGLAL
jgi:pyruvate dehydrogenase E2 component (dihydrolipoamide acetyltransferase)